ncbi:hypothetical protein D8674_034991 [Pyrus ussuriensis x Pyrus communis]|uniref:Uncharacterized protein n=1 Tax=Pyrus ussuriensis x Pyrus communis TaxID=2448454 RepID=A0A5N5GB55_9ROSA|nr:hypothetical protein D8674_034991 [Pyrus ussuriensis x Pyrus communis]
MVKIVPLDNIIRALHSLIKLDGPERLGKHGTNGLLNHNNSAYPHPCEVRAFLGFVSSFRWALALLTLMRWLLAAPIDQILKLSELLSFILLLQDNMSSREGRIGLLQEILFGQEERLRKGQAQSIGQDKVLIRCGREHGYPNEAGILCDVVHERNVKIPERLNWFSGRVITKAQKAGDVDQGNKHKQA